MSKVIKFRAWDYGVMLYSDNPKHSIGLWAVHYLNQHEHVMQYTGIKDLNDKDLYEGDCFMDGKSLVYVDYNEKDACYVATWKGIPEWDSPVRLSGYVKNDIEIIGNIYENPELLSV